MRVLYTTYDLRRAVDIIDIKSRPNVLAPAHYSQGTEVQHPFWYAKVLGIFHSKVSFDQKPHQRMDYLWVRWYAWETSSPGGWSSKVLDRLTFDDRDHQFGFLDPAVVIRGIHLIPAWDHGRTNEYFDNTQFVPEEGDWVYHYVNRCVLSHNYKYLSRSHRMP